MTHQHLAEDLAATSSLYAQLGSHAHHAFRDPDCARCSASQGTGRRAAPASKPPGDLVVVSHMRDLELFVPRWNVAAQWLLNPHLGARVDLTVREGLTCPIVLGDRECGGRLVAWPNLPPQGVIRCMACLAEWAGEWEWRRLGHVAGVHHDGRYDPGPRGPRLPSLAGT
jgi:hypothetical protein